VNIPDERAAIVAEAKTWIGTPFHHGARIKGAGVDCAQLLLACYGDHGPLGPVDVGDYPPDWFLHQDRERLLEWIHAFCAPVNSDGLQPGDIALFRYGRGVSHASIVLELGPPIVVAHSFARLGVTTSEVGPTHHLGSRLVGYYTLKRWRA